MTGRTWYVVPGVLFLTVADFAAAVGSTPAEVDARTRAGVVRLEAAIDPFSAGPEIAAELAARERWTPYEAEVARRLDLGATGSGFLVNAEGYLVTNAHVVLSGVRYSGLHLSHSAWDSMTRLLITIRDIWVTVGEGEGARDYVAVPVAIAEDLDLAVLRVRRPPGDETQFRSLPIAASDGLRLGQPLRALGFPEYEFQATAGEIVSLIHGSHVHDALQLTPRIDRRTGREIILVSGTTPGPVMRLQHSADTGHGSSGSPLVDQRGRVIGVAYALLSDGTGGPEAEPARPGLNLGIASNVVKRFLDTHAVAYEEAGP